MKDVIKAMGVPMVNTSNAQEERLPAMAETQAKSFEEHLETSKKRLVPATAVDGVITNNEHGKWLK